MSSRYPNGGISNVHDRNMRTQLFSTSQKQRAKDVNRVSSPYDSRPQVPTAKENEAYLMSLESQNNEEIDTMSQKVNMLKGLGVRMGDEINKSIKLNDNLTESMEKGKVTLKNTWNRMIVMSQRAGISWRMWLVAFFIIFLFFFWVWIK